MKIVVFGATGKTGIKVVEQGLSQGLEVKAFVRDLGKMEVSHPALSIIQGDVTDVSVVDKAIEGTDVVIITLGASANMQSDIVLAQGTMNIINSMKKNTVKRLVVLSSYAMSGSDEGKEFLKLSGMTEAQITAIKPILDDKIKQEKFVRESGLEFVIVQPLMLTDTKKTGKYRVSEKLVVKPGDSVSRADVADFLLKSAVEDKWIGKTVVQSY